MVTFKLYREVTRAQNTASRSLFQLMLSGLRKRETVLVGALFSEIFLAARKQENILTP